MSRIFRRPNLLHGAGALLVVLFLGTVMRFWHPFYGFTRLIQMDSTDAAVGIPEVRAQPVYVYPGNDGYDGAAYAQIAFHPALHSPELRHAIDNLPYRARRILTSFLAWSVAGGLPAWIANVYASLNIVVWLALAACGWRLLQVTDWHRFALWAGFMLSAGALHSVRFALTDGLACLVFMIAMRFAEAGRERLGALTLGIAALARESILAGLFGLLPVEALRRREWRAVLVWGLLVFAPLVIWVAYVSLTVGNGAEGVGNFSAPLLGLLGKVREVATGLAHPGPFLLVNIATALAFLGLLAQAAFMLVHRDIQDRWWRSALGGLAMLLCFGPAVWEGHPGAATRVLLAFGLAISVLAARHRSGWRWVVLINLSALSGVLSLIQVPQHPAELATGRNRGLAYVANLESGWYGRESLKRHVWSWTSGQGEVALRTTVVEPQAATLTMTLRALETRTVTIQLEGSPIWSGAVGTEPQKLALPVRIGAHAKLTFGTDRPGIRESASADSRSLAFAVYDLRLAASP